MALAHLVSTGHHILSISSLSVQMYYSQRDHLLLLVILVYIMKYINDDGICQILTGFDLLIQNMFGSEMVFFDQMGEFRLAMMKSILLQYEVLLYKIMLP